MRPVLGNVTAFTYKAEDRAEVDPSTPAEGARAHDGCAYTYLKRVRYGNRTPFLADPAAALDDEWGFELVFDYGEHTGDTPTEDVAWPARLDPFSTFRPGFDQRCYRLCGRVLVFHRFTALGASPVLVRSTVLAHAPSPAFTTLTSVTHVGHEGPTTASLPAMQFTYRQPALDDTVRFVSGTDDLPRGLDLSRFQWVDLDGEGLSGLLGEHGGAWWYKPSLGAGALAPVRKLPHRPSAPLGAGRLMDLDGDGKLEFVRFDGGAAGWFPRDDDAFGPLRRFRDVPTQRLDDPSARLLDVDGDGLADLLVTEDRVFRWYPSKGKDGFEPSRTALKALDDNQGPTVMFQGGDETLLLADMTGDGLTDLVRVRNGAVVYWPNKGYGRFGAKVILDGAPVFAPRDRFDPGRVRLADVDGTGPADILYLGDDGVRLYTNQSGNSLAAGVDVPFPRVHDLATVQVSDIEGSGTACLVWSSPLLSEAWQPLRYLRLMKHGKPWLLTEVANGLGKVTRLSYTPSTALYVADRLAGSPWPTRLPFPVQCLTAVEVRDQVTGLRLVSEYAYHHGYYDGPEREFRGFGRVDQTDTETASDFEGDPPEDAVAFVPPVTTTTWFHTGAWRDGQRLEAAFAAEYWAGDPTLGALADNALPDLRATGTREAVRALKGQALRAEVFAADGVSESSDPYTVTETRWTVRQLQPEQGGRPGVYLVVPAESRTSHYERDATDPRVLHTLTLSADDYGHVTQSAIVGYPRRSSTEAEQDVTTVVVTESTVLHVDDQDDRQHLFVPTETVQWELTGLSATDATPVTAAGLLADFTGAATRQWHVDPSPMTTEKRQIGRSRTLYWNDGLTGQLALGTVGVRKLVYDQKQWVLPSGLRTATFGSDVMPSDLMAAGYLLQSGDAWRTSGTATPSAAHFYQPTTVTDPYGNATTVAYDADALFPTTVTDPMGNVTTATIDYRVLAPSQVTDPNGTLTEGAFDALGRLTKQAIRKGSTGDDLTHPTVQFTYELDRWTTLGLPARVTQEAREVIGDPASRLYTTVVYSDGMGNVALSKADAKPDGGPRWVASGRVVRNNKGLPVLQFEPYFTTDAEWEADGGAAVGVSAVLHYDAVGRNVRTDFPNGTFTKTAITGWDLTTHDPNDTVLGSDWYTARIGGGLGAHEQTAATKAAAHANTPQVTHLDSLGRPFLVVEQLDGTTFLSTRSSRDVLGNVLSITDARGVVVQTHTVDPGGRILEVDSADSGTDTVFHDPTDQPLTTWRPGSLTVRQTYDALRRPLSTYSQVGAGSEQCVTHIVYGDALHASEASFVAAHGLRGQAWRQYDAGGLAETRYDFRGRPIWTERTLPVSATSTPEWSTVLGKDKRTQLDSAGAPKLESSGYVTQTALDGLDRPTQVTTPDGSVQTLAYHEGAALNQVFLDRRDGVTTTVVSSIDHDAKGQRTQIDYGNGVTTTYTYESDTFRLATLRSTRASDGAVLQHLSYTYDPVGNLTRVGDTAQDTLYFDNAAVTPTSEYTYDALYRLTAGTGRERNGLGQTTHADPTLGSIPQPGSSIVRAYTEEFVYDAVGNLEEKVHKQGSGTVLWRRRYDVDTASNRLLGTSIPSDPVGSYSDTYTYDARGSMTSMPHLSTMKRDYRDQLVEVNLGSSDKAWYQYDAGGERVRKWVKRGQNTEETVYLGGYEVYRKRVSGVLQDERETVHAMDGQRRVLMAETKTVAGGAAVSPLVTRLRFQLGNHLESALLEVDGAGLIISYEEYHPYGTTAWWALRSGVEVSAKRYRYTGKEKDEETGLRYHSARYYAAWLGRWERADPAGLVDGVNRYGYVSGRPNTLTDPDGRVGLSLGDETPDHLPVPVHESSSTRTYTIADYAVLWELQTGEALTRQQQGVIQSAGCIGVVSCSLYHLDQLRQAGGLDNIPDSEEQLADYRETVGHLGFNAPPVGPAFSSFQRALQVADAVDAAVEGEGRHAIVVLIHFGVGPGQEGIFAPNEEGMIDLSEWRPMETEFADGKPQQVAFDFAFYDSGTDTVWHADAAGTGIVRQSSVEYYHSVSLGSKQEGFTYVVATTSVLDPAEVLDVDDKLTIRASKQIEKRERRAERSARRR